MASGLALVSNGVGGAAEVFEDGISGLSFQAGDAKSLAAQLESSGETQSYKHFKEWGTARPGTLQRSTIGEELETLLFNSSADHHVKAFSVRRWSYIKNATGGLSVLLSSLLICSSNKTRSASAWG